MKDKVAGVDVWRVRPMANRPEKALTRETKCCTEEKPCSWHKREAVKVGYHLCDRCGAICDCKFPTDGVTCVHGPHPVKGRKGAEVSVEVDSL